MESWAVHMVHGTTREHDGDGDASVESSGTEASQVGGPGARNK